VVREPGESRAVRRTVFREVVAQAAGDTENSDLPGLLKANHQGEESFF